MLRQRSWKLSSNEFAISWANSVPVICEGILSMKQISLTPAYFMRTFGDEEVDLINCESGRFEEGSLKDILRLYDTPRDLCDPVLKVKVCSSLIYVTEMDSLLSGLAVSRRFQSWKICRSIRRVRRLLTISLFNSSQRQRQFGRTFSRRRWLTTRPR